MVRELRREHFQRIVNLYRIASWPGALRIALLFLALRAQENIGHGNRGFGLFLDRKAPPEIYQNRHFVDAMTDIAQLAGGILDGYVYPSPAGTSKTLPVGSPRIKSQTFSWSPGTADGRAAPLPCSEVSSFPISRNDFPCSRKVAT